MVVMSYETISRYFTAPGSRLTSVVFRLLRDPPDTVTRNAAFFYNGPLLCLVPAPVYGSGGEKVMNQFKREMEVQSDLSSFPLGSY